MKNGSIIIQRIGGWVRTALLPDIPPIVLIRGDETYLIGTSTVSARHHIREQPGRMNSED